MISRSEEMVDFVEAVKLVVDEPFKEFGSRQTYNYNYGPTYGDREFYYGLNETTNISYKGDFPERFFLKINGFEEEKIAYVGINRILFVSKRETRILTFNKAIMKVAAWKKKVSSLTNFV